jgi:hypothetical protein
MSQPMPVEPEKLKPVLHEKIERMNGEQLTLVSQVLLQVEAEELADRLNEAFDKDREQGKFEEYGVTPEQVGIANRKVVAEIKRERRTGKLKPWRS